MIEERNYLIHPTYIALGLLLAGITALFLAFSCAYLYTRIQNGSPALQLPIIFVYNTVILIVASYVLVKSMHFYKTDQTKNYQISLGVALTITIIFLVSQIIAWKQLYADGIMIDHSNMASYLYIISIVHFAHVILGIPFLALFLYHSIKRMKEPVSVLVYFSDPDKKRKLTLLTVYWHFIDILWVYLVIFFLINSLF